MVRIVGPSRRRAAAPDTLADPAAPAEDSLPRDIRSALRRTAFIVIGCIAVALSFPFPVTKLVLAAVLGLVILIELVQRPVVGLLVLILAFPVADLFPPTLVPIPGLNGQTGIALLAMFGAYRLSKDSVKPAPLRVIFFLLVGLTALELFVGVVGQNMSFANSLTQAKAWLGFLPLYFFVAHASSRSWSRRLVVSTFIFSFSLICAHSVLDYFAEGGGSRLRSTGLIGNQPNVYGGYLAMVLPLPVFLALERSSVFRYRIVMAGIAFLGAMALLFTKSRGAWMAFVVALLVVMIVRRSFKLAAIFVILTIFAGSLLPAAFWERLDETVVSQSGSGDEELDPSTESRIKQWEAFPVLLASSPIIGHGLWTFGKLIYAKGLYNRAVAPHSSVMQFGVEFGLLGLGLYFILMFRLLAESLRLAGRSVSRWDQAGLVGLFAGFLALMVSDLSGARFFNEEVFATFSIMAGLVSGVTLQSLRERSLKAKSAAVRSGPSAARGAAGQPDIASARHRSLSPPHAGIASA